MNKLLDIWLLSETVEHQVDVDLSKLPSGRVSSWFGTTSNSLLEAKTYICLVLNLMEHENANLDCLHVLVK